MFTRRTTLLAAAAAFALTATMGVADAKEAKKIGLAVANLQANFFNQIKQSVEAYGKEKGLEVITVDAKGDAATQVSQIQDLLAQNVDALIYIPAGATAAAVPVKAARAAGVPVVNIDRNAEGSPGDTFIATDSVTSAKQVCDYLAKQAGGKGEMVIVHGQKGTTPEVDRSKGCAEALKGYPDIKVVGELWSEGWHQDEGFKLTSDLLQSNPNVSIIFAQADALALGAAQAVKVANSGHRIFIGGFDGDTAALTALKDGVFDVTATQQTQKMGRLGVDAAIALVAGEKLPAEQLQDATLTTKENVDQFIANHP
ncbi:ribose transport system substrate-binding protein [Kaistia hirudinis]|uniref:Ribose transport system substrate-binding protein n=1 Tax=Kaistia hirudinis TaxID=1293440 RepID=A0A840AMI0_9HYPH|nr:sugar ABC transporter substrate-binding protein [Kaistia hirudinis]MBB3931519.1 ribose transport system substrate-binding protein [Kaistia hirudinis]MBN9016154.1 sugar ABC transporter substrate-binding protein [Hyphomicrobiales bacterium]